MRNFSLCSSIEQIIIIKTTEEMTIYVIRTVKCNKKKRKYQKQLFSKSKRSTARQFKPKNSLVKNVFISLKDVLAGSMGGVIGTLLIQAFQEFGHYLERILAQLF